MQDNAPRQRHRPAAPDRIHQVSQRCAARRVVGMADPIDRPHQQAAADLAGQGPEPALVQHDIAALNARQVLRGQKGVPIQRFARLRHVLRDGRQPIHRQPQRLQRLKRAAHPDPFKPFVLVRRVLDPGQVVAHQILPQRGPGLVQKGAQNGDALDRAPFRDTGQPRHPGGPGQPHQHGFRLIVGGVTGCQYGNPLGARPAAQQPVPRAARLILQVARSVPPGPRQDLMRDVHPGGEFGNPLRLAGRFAPQPVIHRRCKQLDLPRFETPRQHMQKGDGIPAARYRHTQTFGHHGVKLAPDRGQNILVGLAQEHPRAVISPRALATGSAAAGKRAATSASVTQAWLTCPRRPSAAPSSKSATGATGPVLLPEKLAR